MAKDRKRRDVRKMDPAWRKLDARLAFLLSLGQRRLLRLKAREDEQIRELAASRGKTKRPQRFAPLTAGLFLPGQGPRPVKFKEPYISAFVLTDAGAADLAALGAKVRAQAGDVFTVFLPLSRLKRLVASPSVRFVELSRPLFPSLDGAVPYAQLDGLHDAKPPLVGDGVLIGVIDFYLDIYHPDFRAADGTTRIFHLWDQNLEPQGTEAGPDTALFDGSTTYGVEYDQTAIDAELKTSAPPQKPAYQIVRHVPPFASHGTHVTGVAAGSGVGAKGKFTGAAPGANIAFVQVFSANPIFSYSAEGADAIAYLCARAEALGQPCVVNLSLSDYYGPRDGTMLLEKFIDGLLLKAGRAIIVSAGNDNSGAPSPGHGGGVVAQGQTVTFDVIFDNESKNGHTHDHIEIWYGAPDRFDCRITISDKAQNISPVVIGPLNPGQSGETTFANGITVQVQSILDDPRNHDNLIYVTIPVPPGSGKAIPRDWTIELTGTTVVNGAYDAWLGAFNLERASFSPFAAGKSSEGTLGCPGCSQRAITVGSHDKGGPPPTIYDYGGRGPTRDGRVKPELAAVGGGSVGEVTAPRSRNVNVSDPNPGDNPLYVAKVGTSMAAPLAAGACAVLFQCRGADMTWADLLDILKDQAKPAEPVNGFGAGYLQMGAACDPPPAGVDVWLRDNPGDAGVEPSEGVFWLSPDIEVLDADKKPVPNPKHDPKVPFNNVIRVTVRNRGTTEAIDTDVYLYWADPATYLPFTAWKNVGFSVEAGFKIPGNRITVPALPAGAATIVEFAWAPPPPTGSFSKDGHYCLIARLENKADPSFIAAGGGSVLKARNNVAQRNVYVQQSPPEMSFAVVGTGVDDSLMLQVDLAGGQVELALPVQALPWRERKLLDRHGRRRLPFGAGEPADDPLVRVSQSLRGDEIRARTDITGADTLAVADGIATITAKAGAKLFLPSVRIAPGARMPVALRAIAPKFRDDACLVHVGQLSGGRRVGGVSLRVTKATPSARKRRR